MKQPLGPRQRVGPRPGGAPSRGPIGAGVVRVVRLVRTRAAEHQEAGVDLARAAAEAAPAAALAHHVRDGGDLHNNAVHAGARSGRQMRILRTRVSTMRTRIHSRYA